MVSLQETSDQGVSQVSASVSDQLWRNLADRGDPVNLVELDEATRVAIERVPTWPRPA